MQVSSLHIYPVKSCRGIAELEMTIDRTGPVGDRRFLVVDKDGRFLTQREHPRMAQIRLRSTASGWVFAFDHNSHAPFEVPKTATKESPSREVVIWNDTVLAEDCGNEAAKGLAEFLGFEVRLVRAGRAYNRVVPKKRTPDALEKLDPLPVAFGDAFPFLITSIASIGDLNTRLDLPVPMDRFRPNIVIAGCGPYEEDTWVRIKIGDVELVAAGPCGRCIVTTTDQHSGERGKEPLKTLATYRKGENGAVNFGQNFIHATDRGTIRVGDKVTVIERRG